MKQSIVVLSGVGIILFSISGDISADGTRRDITAKTRRAIERALEYLKKSQNSDGSFGSSYQLAASALAGMAFLGYGNLYNEGPYGQQVAKLVHYMLKMQDRAGFFDDNQCRMHGHGYATLFLALVYGSLPPTIQSKVKTALKRAVKVIQKSQSNYGGWYYYPYHYGSFYASDEGSVTVTVVQALRAAKDAGIYVPKAVITKGINYIRKCMTPTGCRYRYRGGHTTYTLTAAAVSVLNAYGVYDSKEHHMGMKVLRSTIKAYGNPFDAARWRWYGNLYAAQAFYQAGDKDWKLYYPKTYKMLIDTQNNDGSWTGRGRGWGYYGACFSTAIAALILEIPLNYLPIFQR